MLILLKHIVAGGVAHECRRDPSHNELSEAKHTLCIYIYTVSRLVVRNHVVLSVNVAQS